jgi:hypothetical protein
MLLTLEGVYTKDINTICFENINLDPAATTIVVAGQKLPYWTATQTRYITSPYTDVIVMRNTNKGQGYSISAQLDLPRVFGFSGMLAYSRSWDEEVTGKTGSDPYSAWRYRQITRELNSQELGLSYNNTPHRFIASVSYSIEYAKYFGSSISFFYTGFKGNAYSYIYSGDANGDGTSDHELMWIPTHANEFLWSTAADSVAYQAFAAQDPYLSKHQGEFMLRNAAYAPWYSRLDMRFIQEFKLKTGEQTNKLQLSCDIINLLNLFNPSWGLNQSVISSSPVQYVSRDAVTGKMTVKMRQISGKYMTSSFQNPTSVSGTWGIQLGIKYLFN